MNDSYTFHIPFGLRPVRIGRSEEVSQPVRGAEPKTSPEKQNTPGLLEASRNYSLGIARKMAGRRPLHLPAPRAGFCCCLGAPKVKNERTASSLELSRLLLVSRSDVLLGGPKRG